MTAQFSILHAGYVGEESSEGMRVGSTVVFAESGITDVVFSHQHIDHTLNAALFPRARFHDYAAVYRGDLWRDEDAEGRVLGEGIRLIRTPGHTVEDISTLIDAPDGLVVCTHAWWFEGGPEDDPYAPDPHVLAEARARILGLGPALVVPGHGGPFAPN